MLVSGSARANAIAFVATWFVTVGAIAAVVALAAESVAGNDGSPPTWTGWLKIVLGLLLLLVAVRQWQGRPRDGGELTTPQWMAAVDAFTPAKAAGLAALLGGVNPKNLLLAVSGGSAIATATSGDTGASIGAAVVFSLVASLGVGAPVVVYLTAGDRAATLLDELKTWMVAHNAVIMAVLLLVIGAKFLGDGITIV